MKYYFIGIDVSKEKLDATLIHYESESDSDTAIRLYATVSTDLRLATHRNRPLTCPNYGSQPQSAADPPPSLAYR